MRENEEETGDFMRYLLIVSHGTFAPGLQSVLDMLVGSREDVLSCCMEDGMGADAYTKKLEETVSVIGPDDTIFLFGDLIGGSPLTNAMNTLTQKGHIANTTVFGGANVPMVITAALESDEDDTTLKEHVIDEGRAAIREFVLETDDDEEDL